MRRWIAMLVSIGLIWLLWWKIDFSEILGSLALVDEILAVLAIALVIPLLGVTSWRLSYIVSRKTKAVSFVECLRLTLAASAMNLVLPAKMGDIAKGVFLKDAPGIGRINAFSLVVLEKASDVLALLWWCAAGLIFYPSENAGPSVAVVVFACLAIGGLMIFSVRFGRLLFGFLRVCCPKRAESVLRKVEESWTEMYEDVDLRTRTVVIAISIGLWMLHLFQIWLFILALGVSDIAFPESLGLSALAVFSGLLPFTFMGVGTRDAALIFLYSPFMSAATAAALGALTVLRYVVPGLLGLPLLSKYVSLIRGSTQGTS